MVFLESIFICVINVLWAVLNIYRVFNTAHNIYGKSLVPCVLVLRAVFSIRLVALAVRTFTRTAVRGSGARILFGADGRPSS